MTPSHFLNQIKINFSDKNRARHPVGNAWAENAGSTGVFKAHLLVILYYFLKIILKNNYINMIKNKKYKNYF